MIIWPLWTKLGNISRLQYVHKVVTCKDIFVINVCMKAKQKRKVVVNVFINELKIPKIVKI
jgi:hypothetical protein